MSKNIIWVGKERLQCLCEPGLENVALSCVKAARALALPGGDGAGVTHVVNASGATYAKCEEVAYLDLDLQDSEDADISQHFEACSSFIDAAREGSQGLVLVHCQAGRSRSATLVAAWLMRQGWSLEDALAAVKRARPIAEPNPGFLQQLAAYQPRLEGIQEGQAAAAPDEVFRLDLGAHALVQEVAVPELHEVWSWEGDESILPLTWAQAVEAGEAWHEAQGPLPEVWTESRFDPEGVFFLTHRSKVLGTILALQGQAADEGTVEFWGVTPPERQKGLGRCLLRLALRRHIELGRSWVRATLPGGRGRYPEAARLLQQEGFKALD